MSNFTNEIVVNIVVLYSFRNTESFIRYEKNILRDFSSFVSVQLEEPLEKFQPWAVTILTAALVLFYT